MKLKSNLLNNLENSNSSWKLWKEHVFVDQVLIVNKYFPESIWKNNLLYVLGFSSQFSCRLVASKLHTLG